MTKRLGNYVQDLRINRDFMDELRFGRLIEKYGGDGFLAVVLLWRWVAVNQPTLGCLGEMTEQDILRVSMIGTKRQEFVCDLLNWEFIRRDETGMYSLTNWVEEQPYVAKAQERSEAGRRAVEKRWGRKADRHSTEEAGYGEHTEPNTTVKGEVYSNTNSNAFKSPPAPPSGGEGEAPVNEIAELYAEVLPELAKPVLTSGVRRDIKARWAAEPERQSLDWWRGLFTNVRTMPRLMGETGDWRASLGWLINRGNLDKVLSGQYLPAECGARQALPSMSLAEYEAMRERQASEAEPKEH